MSSYTFLKVFCKKYQARLKACGYRGTRAQRAAYRNEAALSVRRKEFGFCGVALPGWRL